MLYSIKIQYLLRSLVYFRYFRVYVEVHGRYMGALRADTMVPGASGGRLAIG